MCEENGRSLRTLLCTLLAIVTLSMTPEVATAHFLYHGDASDIETGFDIQGVRLRIHEGDLVGKIIAYSGWDEEGYPVFWRMRVDFDSLW